MNKSKIIICLIISNILFLTLFCIALSNKNIVEKEIVNEIIIEKEIPIIEYRDVRDAYYYQITEQERLLLAQLVYREGRGESFDTQVGIVSVIFNRLQDGYWGKTIRDVIYAKGQFSVAKTLVYTIPNNVNYEAVDYVLLNGSQLPPHVMYFNAGAFVREPYICYEGDNTYFSYQEKDLLKHIGNKGD